MLKIYSNKIEVYIYIYIFQLAEIPARYDAEWPLVLRINFFRINDTRVGKKNYYFYIYRNKKITIIEMCTVK